MDEKGVPVWRTIATLIGAGVSSPGCWSSSSRVNAEVSFRWDWRVPERLSGDLVLGGDVGVMFCGW